MGKAIDFIKKVSKDLHIEKDERETESEWVTRVAYSASATMFFLTFDFTASARPIRVGRLLFAAK